MSKKIIEALEVLLGEMKQEHQKKVSVTPKPTGHYHFTDPCPTCQGKGRVVPQKSDGLWRINYNYQDGHEMSDGMSREEAVERILTHDDRSSNCTLIGPDGQIYSVKE